MTGRPSPKKLAIFTATGCRACDQAILDLQGEVSDLSHLAEVVFWPYVLGSTWEELDQGQPVDICFFAGAIRTAADQEAAQRLRAATKLLVAVGACAAFGGLPGLVNLPARDGQPNLTPATTDPELPATLPHVSALGQVVPVDYVVPGCPPPLNLLWAACQGLAGPGQAPARLSYAASRLPAAMAQAMLAGVLPPRHSIFAGERAVCASCSRVKEEKRFLEAKRPYQAYEESGRCLLEQGLICQGVATREGCGGLCTGVGVPCRGCFGKAPAILDPGAKMVAAISSTIDAADAATITRVAEGFVDLAGTFYRYVLPTQCVLLAAPRLAGEGE